MGYLPPIRDSPTKYEVIHAIYQRTIDLMKELELGYIFLEVDQAIYTKVVRVKFQLLKENNDICEKVIIRMEGFHIMICIMRTIYSQFKGFAFVELMAEVGVGGSGSVENAFNAGDVKAGIRYYKLLYEAIMRLKIKYLSDHGIDGIKSKYDDEFMKCIDQVKAKPSYTSFENILNHSELQLLPRLKGDMSSWLELFLDLVNILINLLHFQRSGNWEGFLELIYQFLPFCFSRNRLKYARDLSYNYLDMIDLAIRNS